MNVKELQEELGRFLPDTEVVIYNPEYDDVDRLTSVRGMNVRDEDGGYITLWRGTFKKGTPRGVLVLDASGARA